MNLFFQKHLKKTVFCFIAAAVTICIITGICLLTHFAPKRKSHPGNRPMLQMDGVCYVDPFMPISYLPEGYGYTGTLIAGQANNTGLEGTQYFTNPDSPEDFYTYQLCGTPTGLNEVDSELLTWQYLRWIRLDAVETTARTMTLDDVRRLAEKGKALSREDLALYDCEEVGSGLYIYSYPVDDRFHLTVGALSNDSEPIYYYLRNKETDDWIDIRTDDVDAFLQEQGRDLDTLRSQCPEYFDLPTDDGLTVYVWQMAENSFLCALLAGTAADKQTLWSITGVSIEEMRAILSAYDVGPENISVEAIRMPHSSYYYDIDEAYTRSVRALLLGEE